MEVMIEVRPVDTRRARDSDEWRRKGGNAFGIVEGEDIDAVNANTTDSVRLTRDSYKTPLDLTRF